MRKWEEVLNRGESFKMSMSTKVCSNHFAAGYRSSECRTPTLYLKGYDVDYKHNRQSLKTKQLDNCQGASKPKRVKQICKVEIDDNRYQKNMIMKYIWRKVVQGYFHLLTVKITGKKTLLFLIYNEN